MNDSSNKLRLTNVKVVFYTGPEDPKSAEFGTSVTVDVTDPAVRKTIEEFCKANNVGKTSDPNRGKANIKEYTSQDGTTTYQYSIKFNDKTKWGGLNGLSQKDVGYGASVTLIANAYDYQKFGGGTAMSASAIVVTSAAQTSGDDDLAALLADSDEGVEIISDVSDLPF